MRNSMSVPDPKLSRLGFRMIVAEKYLMLYKVFEEEKKITFYRVLNGKTNYPIFKSDIICYNGYNNKREIPYSDPTYMSYTNVNELPDHIFKELKHFFSVYKQLEGKSTEVKDIGAPTEAVAIIEEAMEGYNDKFCTVQIL